MADEPTRDHSLLFNTPRSPAALANLLRTLTVWPGKTPLGKDDLLGLADMIDAIDRLERRNAELWQDVERLRNPFTWRWLGRLSLDLTVAAAVGLAVATALILFAKLALG